MLRIDPTAGSLGIAHLYHYESFNEEFLISTLREQKIHCSTPGALNDPWDCQPYFDYRPMVADPAKLEATIVALREMQTPELRADPQLAELEGMLRTDPDFLQHCMEGLSRHMREEVARHKIYCLTTIPDSTLMWSHYARNHTGICLEFAVDNPLLRHARPIRYRATYPEYAPAKHEALELVLTKSKDWIYENEFRLVSSSLDGALKLSGDYFLLPPGALVGVIIGCQAQDSERMAELIKEHAAHLRIKHARRAHNHYQLQVGD